MNKLDRLGDGHLARKGPRVQNPSDVVDDKSRTRRSGLSTAATKRGLLKQDYLLGVVYDLISEHGIESLTMRNVAERSNVSTGTINYHFKNKENLLIAALEEAYSLPKDWANYKGSSEAQLRRIANSYILRAKSDRWWLFWINYLAYSTRHPKMQVRQSERYGKQLRFWAQLITDGQEKGEFCTNLDPVETARRLLTTVHGLVALQLMKGDAEIRVYAREQIGSAIDALVSR